LDGRTDGDVANLDVIRLLDGKGDGAGDGVGRDGELVAAAADLLADFGLSMESASSVRTKPGDTAVVRSTPSVDSCRSPSSRVRTAFLVAA
jgi:hypothetical protein